MSQYILAIDLGTSGAKVALSSAQGEIVGFEFEATPLLLLPNGGAEQNPNDWWRAIKNATARLLAKRTVPVEEVVAICCTSQYSGATAVDKSGRPLMNAINWMDTRGARYVKEITGGLITVEGYGIDKLATWLRLTGGIPTRSGKDSIAHILFIQNELPDVYRQTYKFLEPKDYLNSRFTGKFAATYDSINLHWLTDNRDISNIHYDKRLLAMAGVDSEKLPDLLHAGDLLGELQSDAADELGLGKGVVVVAGMTDTQSVAIGAGAVKDYQPHLYIGTSSWVSCHVPFMKTDIVHSMASLPSAIPGRYYVANEQECAGMCLNYLRDNVFFHDDELGTGAKPQNVYKLFDAIAERVPAGSEKVIFTPWLYGERTPVEDHSVRGGFFNQSLKTTREHLVRAVFEGVAYNARWLFECLEKFVGRRLDNINMIGGGANSNVWCQIHADVLGRTIRQVKDPILGGLRGAALLAAVALGRFSFDEIPDHVEVVKTYTPNLANREIYDELFAEFVKIYENNKRMYARLNRAH